MICRVVIENKYGEDYFDFLEMAEACAFATQAFDHQKGDDNRHDLAVRIELKEAEA